MFCLKTFLPCLLTLALIAPAHAAESGILSHESSVSLHEWQPVMNRVLPKAQKAMPLPTKTDLPAEQKLRNKPLAEEKKQEECVKHTALFIPDVYALSPYARMLALPRALPQSLPQEQRYVFSKKPSHTKTSLTQHRFPQNKKEWGKIIAEAHEIFGLDKELIAAVIYVESNFDKDSVSSKGAVGGMQIMPATQIQLGLIDPFDARANVYAGSQYLMELLNRFGRVDLALAAYNAGPGNVEKYGGIPPFTETREFVRRVMACLPN